MECTSCPPNSMLHEGKCIACFENQYYDSLTLSCRNCHLNCGECYGPDEKSCLSCTRPLYYNRLTHQCSPCCSYKLHDNGMDQCCECDRDNGSCRSTFPTEKRRTMGNEYSSLKNEKINIESKLKKKSELTAQSTDLAIVGVTIMAITICVVSIALFATLFIALLVQWCNRRSIRKYDSTL
ncbi:furin-like protease 2 [Copidosoma floridanum]|uniref:furin-like protease 2 n=1 Tax=Copidosoma floridanum TaxID=29053 RepID=UPI0006C98D70|nr:furin-like protease 2 [Copidosoma floridanum]